MPTVKIKFIIEVDNEPIVEHCIEQDGISHFDDERKFALDVINKMNCFYTEKNLYRGNWIDLIKLREKMKMRQQDIFSGDA